MAICSHGTIWRLLCGLGSKHKAGSTTPEARQKVNKEFKRIIDRFLCRSGLALVPVRVRGGLAKSARWTLYPWTSYWRGIHELELQTLIADMGDLTGWSCWDLGAHYGFYSVGLAMRAGPSGQVAAFEPNPVSYCRLERHVAMNKLSWVRTFRAAVSDHAGKAELYTYGETESTTTHLAYEGETRQESCLPLEVEIVCLDEMVDCGVIRNPNLVKIDVEGHGHKALAGARKSIQAKRPSIVAALHGKAEADGMRGILGPLGYKEHHFPWCPIVGDVGDVLFRV